MALDELLRVLRAVESIECRYWLEGGWGVDALVGHQTRPHRDVDIDIDSACEGSVLSALADLGYVVETDWRPNRVELAAPDCGWVDVHPLLLDGDGGARQAALEDGYHVFPRSFFTIGSLDSQALPCMSVEAQRLFHTGYEPRPVDEHDLALLDQLALQFGSIES
jgi:lincosamide nucleotidyltransferase A/C/D/E